MLTPAPGARPPAETGTARSPANPKAEAVVAEAGLAAPQAAVEVPISIPALNNSSAACAT